MSAAAPGGVFSEYITWLVRVIEDVQGGELRTRQGYVPAHVLKEKQTAERDQTALAARRQAVVRELVETEEEFGRDMQQVVSRYMKPIDKATTPKAVFDNRELLFSNFRQICEFHNTVLLEGIKYYASEPKMLGRALLRMEREFDKHVGYCRDEPRAQHLLATNPIVNKYFQDLADSLRDDKGIAEHLKLPIQRINDYQLLLKELVKYSKRLGEDCTDLQKALELFLSVPNRATDNKFIASIEGFRGNIYKLGRLLTHDWFTVTDAEGKARERYVFLFKARVLICKVKRVSDDRSVFVLKDIVKLPEVEIKENPAEPLKFQLCQKDPPLSVTLAAHKEQVKNNWLGEIRKHASDVVALAEHAADDLQLLPTEAAPAEPEEKKKKREHAEVTQAEAVDTKEKRSRVEVATTEEAQQLKTKRKASIESEVATKISKSEVTEVSSVSEAQESVKVSSVSAAKSEVISGSETVSSVTVESSKVTEKTASASQSAQSSQVTVVAAASEVKVAQATSVQTSQQTSVQSTTVEQSAQEIKVASAQKSSVTEQSTVESTAQKSTSAQQSKTEASSVESKKEVTSEKTSSVEQSSKQESVSELKTQTSVKETVQETVVASQQSNVQEVKTQQSVVEESKETKEEQASTTGVESQHQAVGNGQTVTAEEVVEDEMSRYSRSSRLTGEYSSSSRTLSSGGRYESSSTYDSGSGLTSSYSRRESGSRLEASKYESGGALEGTASSRYESKYSSKTEGGSKYGIESSYESKSESGSKYGIEYDAASKIDSIASKYGIESNIESKSERSAYAIEGDSASKIDSIASKYASKRNSIKSSLDSDKIEASLEAKYESKIESSTYGIESDTTSKIDSIASKYASKRNSIKASIDGDKVESISSKSESSYETVKNGGSSYESRSSKKSIANGSVSTGYETARSISKSDSQDGKPIFTKTLEGQNIEPGENAIFECLLRDAKDVKVKWLKDNKPMGDRLMDRCSISIENDGSFKLELKHCREEDAGVYTAIAENVKGNAHCTAQLVVQELTPEERKERNALKAPYFLVALKDTEIMENTYLRFMVNVKGDPNPDVKFYRDDKEILTTSDSDRVSIIRTRADRGCYELVISDVLPSDAGKYSCKAMNIYGEVTSEATVTVVDDKNIFGELPPGGEGLLAKGEKPTFVWKRDGQNFDPEERFKVLLGDDEDSLALVFQHVKPEDAGIYTCVAKTSTGNISCSAELTVQGAVHELHREPEKPTLVIEHREAIVSAGASAMLELVCKGFPKPNVVFKHNGKDVEADTRHNYRDDKEILTTSDSDRVSIIRTRADRGCYELVISDVLPSDAGKYSCKAMNIYGEVTSEATVTVVDDKNIFGELPPGGEGLLAKGEKPTFVWKRDGQNFDPEERFKVLLGDDEDSLALVFQHVKPEDAGIYTCVAKTSTGNISCSAELTVQGAVHELHREPEKPTLVIEHREAIVSAGASAMLELVCKGFPKPNVVFKHNGKDVEADTRHKFLYEDEESMSLVIKNVSQADAGEYLVTASNELGEDSTTMHLVVKAAPKIKKKIENQTCMVSSTHTVTIEIEGTPSPDVTFYKDGVELKSSDRILIVKESDEVYKITIKDAKLTDTGSYSVVAKNEVNQCSDFWQWHVTSPPKVTKTMGGNKVCEEKETVSFKVETESEPAPTVAWFKNKVELTESSTVKISSSGAAHSLVITSAARADAGEYSCEIRNIHGSTSDSCVLNVKSGPQFTQRLSDTSASEGDKNIEFTVAVEAFPEPTVKWYLGDVEITEKKSVFTRVDSGNTHKLILKEVSAEYSGNYSCRVSNVLGEDSCSATFTVNRKPRFTKSLIDMTVDAGQTLKLDVEVEGCPEPKVKWYKDGKEVTTDARIKIERDTKRLENYHLTVTLVKEEDGGDYEVRAENEFGSVSSKSTVTVHTREIHSTLNKEAIVESEVDDESKKAKQPIEDDVDSGKKKSAKLAKAETVEEKSIWDDEEDGKAKKSTIDEVDKPSPRAAKKSITEPEVAEEKSFWDDADDDQKSKKPTIEEVESKPAKAKKSITEPEVAEEKSFWDDADDQKTKQPIVEEPDTPLPSKARKSVTEPEVAEEKSFWDDVEDKPSKPTIEEIDSTPTDTGKKSFSEPETAEEKSFWDENHNEQNKKPVAEEVVTKKEAGEKSATKPEVIEEVPIAEDIKSPKRKSVKKQSVEEPLSAETEGRVFQTVTTFKTGEDGAIIMSKVSSTRSHGAIVTGPAETHTLHKMTSTSLYYDDDDFFGGRRLIQPNKPHTTSLEVEEIASHSYFLTEMGHYSIPDHVRRGTYGIIEEPQTDSEADTASRCGRQGANRTVSIMSVSEDEMSWQNEPLSREISIEDLSKSIFDIDETRKVFSKDSYVRSSSFKEDYIIGEDEEESLIVREKSQKIFENDITEKLIHISKEFDENEYKSVDKKIDNVKNRIIEELVLSPVKNYDNITKDVTETTVERKRKNDSKLVILEEEEDDEIEALLKRSQRQRSILDDILNVEDEKAPPAVKGSSMKDGHAYESLPLVYSVEVSGTPKPTIRWLHDGKEVKPCGRVHITNDGDLFKLEIDAVQMKDAGKWQCEIINNLGKQVQTAQLSVSPESELRKPKFTTPLEAQRVMQKEPVTMQAVCTADPQPHVSWLLNGNELTPSASIITSADTKELEHGLKECTFTLQIPTGRHTDTGEYTLVAKNKYGVGESSARLDILLRPEVEGLKDVTAVPYEETTFIANVRANPIAEVKWHKDGYEIQPTGRYDIVSEAGGAGEAESHRLTVRKVGVDDAGVYTLIAKNEVGETSQQARLSVHTGVPVFTKPLQKQSVRDYDDCTLKVRCDGVPKPDVLWYKDGEEISNDERHKVTTEVGGQVDSELEIKHFNSSDAGKYKVRAVSLAGEASCEAAITLEHKGAGFAHKLDRQKDVDEGEPLELKAKLDGSPIPTAKWFKDGVPLSPEDSRVQQSALPDGTVRLSIARVTPADCGAYKLVISNPHGDSSALCAVAVNPTPRKPSFSQELEDTKAVVGQPLKLEARVMAFPAPEIKWFKDGLPVRPSQAINFINQPGGLIGLSIDSCKPEDAGVYSLTVTNKLGEVESKAKVEVGQKERKPAFIAELQPTKVIEGFPVKLEVKILGHPPPTLKWTHNGKEIIPDGQRIRIVSQPDGTHALLIDSATPADAGQYGVSASNDKGESSSNADLTVASRTDDSSPQERPRFIHGLRDLTAEEGQPLSVSAPFVGNPVPEVSWTKDGVPIKPNEKIRLTCDGKRVGLEINPVELPDAGVYGIKLVNPLGEDASEGTINVRKVYSAPTFSQKFTDLQQLPTFDAKFPARVFGIPFPDITWYKDGVPLRHSDKYNIKRDGDACCLYVRDLVPGDAGRYKCVASNREGEASCEAKLEVVDKIARQQKVEPPEFLKKIGDIEVFRGMSAKFTACATGTPEPDVEWFRNDERLFPCERIRMDKESTGLLRLTISGVDPTDVGTYRCRIYNPHGEDSCSAQLTYDTLEPHVSKRPIGDQYSDFDKMKKTGIPMPLADPPIIRSMADRHLTLGWKPSIPHGPRFPVTYQVEMCEVPDGDWFTARTGLRSCVCDIRNLEPFRDYKFRIRVENKYGVSDPSPFAITHRAKLEPDPPKFIPYLEPGIDFRPETSPYFPKDFDIERPPHDGYAQAPRFLRQEYDSQYGVKGHNVNLFWFVYGYPKPKMTYFFNDEPIDIGGRYDWSYTRNGQATLFINKMLERDAGWYEAVATNEHGQARQRVRLEVAEYPAFIKRPEEVVVLERKTARLEARVTGVPYPEIKWYKDWQPLAPSSRTKIQFIEPDTCILVIHDVILKDEGLYSISARNVAGAVSSSAMLHVEESEHEYNDRMREHPPRIKASTKPFGDFYDLGDELGRGVQGVVYHAAERLTGRNYAAKIMHGHSDLKPFMKNELDILNLLNDRHLVRLQDAYEHEHTLALVLELAAGGELVRDRLLRSQGYTEREIAGYIRQVLRGIKYMHDNSVAHLGLTIGELLLSHAGSDSIKLCDFGLSRRIQFNKHASLDYGMPEFVAPEVAAGEGVSFAADMWSIGIITYILLSGHSPFRGVNDRETLTRIREGTWDWHDEEWWSRLSTESRDFISKLLIFNWHERMDVNTALSHPWLTLADKIYHEEYQISTDRLRNYYNLYRDWTSNAQCRTWFRRKPLSGAYEHPSKMVYPPGETHTPEATPERERPPHDRQPGEHDVNFKQWDHPDWEVSAKSESHYQNGPDTYLLQLRDTQFPVRLREYMKVACDRSPGYSLNVFDTYDPRTPIIRERRRFTDIMDEEIDDERRERINNYGTESYTIRRLRHELGTRLDSYAEAQAFMESKKDGQLPFFREKPQLLPVREGETAQLSCFAVGDPKPVIQWFKNDMVIAEGQRIKIIEDEDGRSTLRFEPAKHHDIGFYKVVARNKVGQTVARTRIVEATTPDAPDSPTAAEVSDTEVLLRWKQPKYDGNSTVICYSLQYKAGDSVEWRDVANNIDHEFFVVRNLSPDTSYQFRLSSRNRIGWSDKGIPTHLVKTKNSGAPKIEVTKAMRHLQQITESGQEVTLEENKPKLDYSIEDKPVEWVSSQQFTERYSFVSELWRGKFSMVVKGIDKTNDNVVVSKILENRPDTEVQIQREFECLRRLRHERISNLIAAYQAPGSSVSALILEKLQGADILTYLSSRHDYTEQMVATIVTQILDGLQYLHWRGYCHLDLQPDNVVMASVRSIQVKLIDFGSAHKVTKLGTSVPQVGELEYKAPEIINDEPAYPQTDIWSVGVLTYIMLSGVSPFRGADDAETKQNISFVRFRFEHLYKEITQEATRFLMFLFKKVPLKRPLTEECYEHRWLTQSDFMNKKRERAVFLGNRLKEFSESYHERKSREASQADTVGAAFGAARQLARSNSIQDELLTNFSSH
uniref:Hemolin n=1 Tax=Heliothis virescens TaxID=7102 RepID=A0A2A4JMB9_HELVI